MSLAFRTVCLLAVCCMTVALAGCSKKSVQSTGDTSRTKMNASKDDSSYPASRDAYNGLESARNGEENLTQDTLIAKSDPSKASRQLEEMQAEQRATAAAGLRDVFFGYDSWMISEEGRQILARNAEWLRTHNMTTIKVEGHCDERGSSSYNFVLAEKRAKAVRNYLMDLGIKGERVSVVSYGKERPFCNEHSELCYQQNRRGHLVVKP